jgi:hypothetical protein
MGLSRGGHNLDSIIEKDSIGFGYEVKLAMSPFPQSKTTALNVD